MTELGQMMNPADWSKAANQWDLTSLLIKVLQVNGAPLFDVAVQVDDRNTSRYVISVGLPRQSGVVPSFYSPIPQVRKCHKYYYSFKTLKRSPRLFVCDDDDGAMMING